jgi:hypothetical protein
MGAGNSTPRPMEDEAAARRAVMLGWAMRELAPWRNRQLDRVAIENSFAALNATERWVSLFHIAGGTVSVVPKPDAAAPAAGYANRTRHYLALFQQIAPALGPGIDTMLCMSMDDGIPKNINVPHFGFQKKNGAATILLPDVDFLFNDFYERSVIDTTPYADKKPQAVFAGTTTGARLTPAAARALASPRLQAASYFDGNPRVDFRLPGISNCTSPDAEDFLRSQLFCQKPRLDWDAQFQSRFILSIDGNGATCSRVVIALASNSVLAKYASEHVLYYFGGLQPWVHYVPITANQDVETTLDFETRHPERFAQIAAAGRQFAADFLSRQAVLRYTAILLRDYAEMLGA